MTEQNPQTLFLGQYIQESGADAKPQPIEWLVLDRVILEDSSSERGSAEEIGSEEMSPDETGLENYSGREALLLVSRYALDSRTICQEYGETTWMECDLRTWLQTDFFENAFTPEEQDRILRLPVLAQANPEFDTAQGEDTLDRIFLLSIPEVEKYFLTEEQMRCAPTPYAAEKLSYENDRYRVDGKGSCWWWLRTMGADPTSVSLVRIEGTVFANGHFVDSESGCIRPAMWVLIS